MKTDFAPTGPFVQNKPQDFKSPEGSPVRSKIPDTKAPGPSPDYKVELSGKLPHPVVPSLPEAPRPKLEEVAEVEVKEKAVEKVALPPVKVGSVKRPSIIFIKGLDVFSSPSKSERGYAGVGKLAESVEGARIYGWGQKQEIIDEVIKTHPNYPVILVGHSLGGDTAVEVANALDSLEHKFRPVDLLVTMDAVGFNNDIIPQNVKRHLNVFGENDSLLNDGPHVARRNETTKVTNILSQLDHTDIDDDKGIQYEVVNLIQETLAGIS